jgi:hypothetical protein
MGTIKYGSLLTPLGLAVLGALPATAADSVHWSKVASPTEAIITGGPWTLEQSGAANGLKSVGYCDANQNQIGNPGTMRMQPYYFPSVVGRGRHLQGYFDYRPKDTDEAVVAAWSDDAGHTWTFQQKVLELRTTCPSQLNKEPDGSKDSNPFNLANNSDNGDDDGQGHQYVIKIAGHTYLYTLDRASGHIDQDDLIIHEVQPQPGLPLSGAPAMDDAPTDASPPGAPEPAFHTQGLLNPDGILGIVPGSWPLKVIYEQKVLGGDLSGPTALPAAQQCATGWSGFYAANGGLSANDDVTYLRLATTTDGIHFTDVGALQGLNDPTTVSMTGTRWLATAGTILRLADGRYGLLFSGGGCIDADSDAFHYIGYAESRDLLNWTVINGINNPIVSVSPATLTVDGTGQPAAVGQSVTIPAQKPVVGNTVGWFAGRVYAPSATLLGDDDVTVVFAGYHTQKPKNGLGDYRTIGRFVLHSSERLISVGTAGDGGDIDAP